MVFVSPLFTERDREGLAEKVARARETQPAAQEIGFWFTMDIADQGPGGPFHRLRRYCPSCSVRHRP